MLFPHTESSRIVLRPAGVKDAPQAYEIQFQIGYANLPVIDEFVESFGQGFSGYFIIYRKDTDEPVGFSTISSLNSAGHVQVEVNLAPDEPGEFRTDAMALTTNIAFSMWRTRKVYFQTTEPEVAKLGFGSEHAAMVRAEAVLRDYVFFHGRVWDIHVYAIYRDDWDVHGVDLLKQIV